MPETPANLTLGQLQNNLWGFLFDPNVGLLANVRNSINNSQSSVTSGVAYHSNQLSNQLTSNTNAIQNHLTQSTSQLAGQVSYIYNAIANQITSNMNAISNHVDQTENDINSNVSRNSLAIQNYSASLADAVKHKIDISTFSLGEQINNLSGSILNNIGSQIGDIRSTVDGIERSVGDFVGNAVGGISDVLKSLFDPFITFINGLLELFKKWFEENVTSKLDDFFNQLARLQKVHYDLFTGKFPNNPDLLTDMGITNERGAITSKLILMVFSIPTIISLFSKITEPSWRDFIYKQEATQLSRLVDPEVIIKNYFKDIFNRGEFVSQMNRYGFGIDAIDRFIEASRALLSLGDLTTAFRRGYIDDITFRKKIKDYGYSDFDSTTIFRLSETIPSLSDIITMAVREVFSPETAKKFGQFEDYPSILTGHAAKQGLSEEWSKNYWAAHWTLPSITQAFEMLHRRVINLDDMNVLLKAQDIMPYWRDKLTAISYNPLTRVDVRRMYRLGVLTRDEVKSSYLDLGYNEQNAERLTEFTIRYETQDTGDENSEIRQLTKSIILKAYNRGTLTRPEAMTRLSQLGYIANDIELLLTIQDYDNEINKYPDRTKQFNDRMSDVIIAAYRKGSLSYNDALERLKSSGYRDNDATIALTFSDLEEQTTLRASIVGEVKQQYIERTITSAELTNLLNQYRFTTDEIRKVLVELNTIRDLRSKKPSQAQFDKLLGMGVISEDDFKEEMRGLGYAEKYIDYLVSIALS